MKKFRDLMRAGKTKRVCSVCFGIVVAVFASMFVTWAWCGSYSLRDILWTVIPGSTVGMILASDLKEMDGYTGSVFFGKRIYFSTVLVSFLSSLLGMVHIVTVFTSCSDRTAEQIMSDSSSCWGFIFGIFFGAICDLRVQRNSE